MISIIVSSFKQEYFEQFSKSVEQTAGVPFEIIKIKNPGMMGLCEAYNKGAAQAKYSCLCFIHEDILFETTSWGPLLISHFDSAKNPGIIGIAGSVYKTRMLSSWWQYKYLQYEPKRCVYIQHFKYNKNIKQHPEYINPNHENRSEVVCLDGMFLSMLRDTWYDNKFDQDLLKGFHGYDLDICLSVSRTKINYTVYDILVHHYSEGKNDLSWIRDNIKVHYKHKDILPKYTSAFKGEVDFKIINQQWLEYWLKIMIGQKISVWKVITYYNQMVHLNGRNRYIDNFKTLGDVLYWYKKFWFYSIGNALGKITNLFLRARLKIKNPV